MCRASEQRTIAAMAVVLIALVAGVAPEAQADRPGGKKERAQREMRDPNGRAHRDIRHRHEREYPRHEVRVKKLPKRHSIVKHRDIRYRYHRGVWYRPLHSEFVVTRAPIGAYVRWLPPHHTSVWFGGVPYFYANFTYYLWHPERYVYEVVEPPGEVEPVEDFELFVYPQEGQSEEQLAEDRWACHEWARNQTSFDPSLPVPADQETRLPDLRERYRRASTACLEARGYSVR